MTSILTNTSAMQGLQVLEANRRALEATQKRLSTGLKVADAKDNGSTFIIAQNLRSQIASRKTVADSLNNAKSLLDVTAAASQNISDLLTQMRKKAVALNDTSLDTASRSALMTDLQAMVKQIDTAVTSASFNGTNLMQPEVGNPVVYAVNSGYQTSLNIAQTLDGSPGLVSYNYSVTNSLYYARDYMAASHDRMATATKSDVEAYFTSLGYSAATADSYFDQIDGDGDGNLTKTERDIFFSAPALGTLDTDTSGGVSQSEFEAYYTAQGGSLAQADGVYARLDADGDGNVTAAEHNAYYAKASTFPNPPEVMQANISVGGAPYFSGQESVSAYPGQSYSVNTPAFRYNYADNDYLTQKPPSDVTFSASTSVGPVPNPTPASYGVALNSITFTPIVNYRLDYLSGDGSDKLSLFKQPMTTQWLGLQNIASMDPQTLLNTVESALTNVNFYAEYFGRQQSAVDQALTQNSQMIDTLTSGVGDMVDADLSKESAKLQSEQTQQTLATHSLAIANRQPQWLLQLFK
jgi:flagellin